MTYLEFLACVGGISGILATMMSLAYRYIDRQIRSDRERMENKLTSVIKDYNSACRDNKRALIKHTKIQTELITWLKAKNGNK